MDVLFTVFTVVMCVGGGGLGAVWSICSVFTLCTAVIECIVFAVIVFTRWWLGLFTTGWTLFEGWVGFVKWDGGWGVGALEGGCVL